MITIQFNPLNAEEVNAAFKVVSALTNGAITVTADPAIRAGAKVASEDDAEFDETLRKAHTAVAAEYEASLEQARIEKDLEKTEPAVKSPALDARGMPWDSRIHSSSKALLANGNWKNKRGVDADLLANVEAELLGTAAPEEAAQPAPEAPKPAPTGAPSLEDLRAVLADKADEHYDAIAKKLEELGASSMTLLDPKYYGEVLSFLNAL